jgi:adenylyltransferase/sulfurtransferase
VARERLLALNPAIEVVAHDVELRAANVREVLAGYDVILDGTDRLATRYLVNDACVLLGKPLVSAAIHRFEGQVMTYVPGRGPCYRCLYADVPEGLVPNCADAGVLGVLPGVLGAVQATEAIKLVLGAGEPLVGRLLVYDALEMRFHEFAFPRRTDCAVCGDRPSITEPRDPPAACDVATLARVRRISPVELHALLDAGPRLVIDVREPREFAVGHLPGAVNIPLGALRARLGEIPAGIEPVFVCRSGGRSLRACSLALDGGLSSASNLEGGMLAWAATVDPDCVVAPA